MSGHLAQVNVVMPVALLNSARLAEFTMALKPIDTLGDAALRPHPHPPHADHREAPRDA